MRSILPRFKLFASFILPLLWSFSLTAQINLGSAAGYSVFAGAGAITNTGVSAFTGNIGANTGAVSGFQPPTTIAGSLIDAGGATAIVRNDLITASTQLSDMAADGVAHATLFGGGETINTGVYVTGAASSLNGSLILDAEGNPNAVFVFIIGGAFTASDFASVELINQAKAGNIYFITTGEIIIGAGSTLAGTWIANDGAFSMAANASLDGRVMAVVGAINLNEVSIQLPENILLASDELLSFSAKSGATGITLHWQTIPNNNFGQFEIERAGTDLIFSRIGSVAAATQLVANTYNWLDAHPPTTTCYYRLKTTTVTNLSEYSELVKINTRVTGDFVVYPNPVANNRISISFKGKPAGKYQVSVFTLQGIAVMSKTINHNGVDVSSSVYIDNITTISGGYLIIRDPALLTETFKLLIAR